MKKLLLIAMLGAIVGVLADVLLLYSPMGGYEDGTYHFLLDISSTRLAWGHYLGVLFIPLECIGFYVIYRLIRVQNPMLAVSILVSALYILCLGTVYHGMVAPFGNALQQGIDASSIYTIRMLLEPLGAALFVGFLITSLLLFYWIWKKESPFSRWVAWFNPFFIYLLFVALYIFVPVVGNLIIVTGFNLSLLLFFLTIYPYVEE